MKEQDGKEKLEARRTRIRSLLSWFVVFQAKGIISANLSTSKHELEHELAVITRQIKSKGKSNGDSNLCTHG